MRSRTLFTVLVLHVSMWLHAQQAQLSFSHLSVHNGLSHNKVNCILQDKRGFVWIGTEDGLNRFDGRYFTHFKNIPGNAETISGNIITGLLEDEDGIIWIATADAGLSCYNYRAPASRQFNQHRHVPGDTNSIPVNIVNAITSDRSGNIWLATGGNRVLRFVKSNGKFDGPVQQGTRNALALAIDDHDTLWAGRQGGGLLKVNIRTLQYSMDNRYNNLYAKLPHAAVSSLFKDSKGNVWFGSWDKILYRYDPVRREEKAYPALQDEILAFAEDASGRIWMGGKNKGLVIYDPQTDSFISHRYDPAREGTIPDDRINSIYIGKDGLVWLGTNHGVSIHNPSQRQFEQEFIDLPGKDLEIFDLRRVNGKLWVGTSEGLYIREPGVEKFRHVPLNYRGKKLAVSKIFLDENGTCYLGTDFSLFICNTKDFSLSLLPETEKDPVVYNIIESRIVCITKDYIAGHPALIVVPYGHFIAYYDLTERKWTSRNDTTMDIIRQFNMPDHLIRKIVKTRKGNLWMATGRMGLGRWTRDSLPHFKYFINDPTLPGSTISNNNVFDIQEDAQGKLWVSTYGGGLNHFDPASGAFTHIPSSSNLLEGLQLDKRQNVWMVSNGQLHKYDPYHQRYYSYDLPDVEKSGGIHGHIFRDTEGQLYVTGNNYLIRFKPEEIKEERGYPKVYFTDFRIFSSSFNEYLREPEIRLPYNKNYFTFDFAAPEFAHRNTSYAYMLEGFDTGWVDGGDRNYASYSNLDGGSYLLKVKASNRKGSWGTAYTAMRIRIIPPFWKTWWFYLLCAAAVASATYAVYRYRINEFLSRQTIRNKIAADLHDNVGSTLSSIGVYSEVAQIYLEQQKHKDLAGTLEKIRNACGEMISEMGDTVWAINPRNDHMHTILQRMDSFARPLLAAQDVSLHMQYTMEVQHLNLEMTKRKNFYLIFKEAVNNAYKYAHCRNVWMDVRIEHNMLRLSVKDDGAGFNTEEVKTAGSLSGNGLQNIQRRASEMKGDCVITSIPGVGTSLILRFPLP